MSSSNVIRSQLLAIAELRWRMFVNKLRTRRGKFELVSRIIVTSVFTLGGLGAFAGSIALSWLCISQDKPERLAFTLWGVFMFWQVFPVMATAFTNNPDSSELLRFPLAYRSFFLVRLAYGFFDPASALGSLGLLGTLIGVTIARVSLLPAAFAVLAIFALFNLVLMQTVFAWIERWLAQRRTREILGVLFILFMLSFQLIGPIVERLQHKPVQQLGRIAEIITQIQAALPPGIAAYALSGAAHGQIASFAIGLLALAGITVALAGVLHIRLRLQFRGENLSEAAARPIVAPVQGLQVGWDVPAVSSSVAAVFEKEVRYLFRSMPMLLTVVMPVFVLIIFRLGPANPMRHSSSFSRTPDMAFPGAAAYAILVLTNLVFNCFGGDGSGMQFFYASPVTFSQIVLGKNLLHAGILVGNTTLAWFAVAGLYGVPHLPVTVATIIGMFFAAPLNFAAGNLLSMYSPKKRDFAVFGRQNVSQTTVLASFGVQIVIVAVGIGAFALARVYDNLWIASFVFLILCAISIPVYVVILKRLDVIALDRRETLLAELCRA